MSKARILVADDDRLILYTLTQGLRSAGYEVLEAEDGRQAVRMGFEHQPDLALLDIRMPELTGIEAAQRLHAEAQIPCLFLSAYDDAELVRQATEEGALGYLVKPLDVAKIIPSIEAALARAAEIRRLREAEQSLNVALKNSREISIAIGLVAERYALSPDEAFEALRSQARSQRRKVVELAAALVDGSATLELTSTKPSKGR